MNMFSRRSLSRLEGLDPDLVAVMVAAVSHCPVDFAIVEGVRTRKRQQELYAQGRTKPGKVVTKVDGVSRIGKHQVGKAVDVCPWIDGELDWNNVEAFETIARHVKRTAQEMKVDIVWGGDWKGAWDKPHFEVF